MKKIIIMTIVLFVATSAIIAANWGVNLENRATIAASTPIWPTFHYNMRRTGQCPYDTENSVAVLRWKFKTGLQFASSPAIGSDGTIYFGSGADGYLYALNSNGTVKWRFKTGNIVQSSPAIGSDGTIYVGSHDHYLYAVNPNGRIKWRFKTGNYISSSPAIGTDGTIYIGSYDHYLYAVNSNGTLKWRFKTEDSIDSSPAIGTDGTIYIGSWDNYLYAVKPDGRIKWRFKTGKWIDGTPAIGSDGTIYIGSHDNYLYAINPNGTLKWRFKTGEVRSAAAMWNNGTIYVGSYDHYLYAINPNGTLKWKYKTGGKIISSSPALDKNGIIYIGSNDYYVYAINPNGTLKWKYKTTYYIHTSPVIDKDGIIYIGSYDGYLYALSYPNLTVPQNFKAASAGTTINFKWDYPSYSGTNPLYFYIYEYNYSTYGWQHIKTVQYPTKKAKITGESYGKHAFKIRAVIDVPPPNPDRVSNLSSSDLAYVLHTPKNLEASVRPNSSYVDLTWQPVDSNATKIAIYRNVHGTSPGFFLMPIATIPYYKTSYTDTSTKPNTKYDYWIYVIREDDNFNDVSYGSNTYVFLTLPEPPSNLQAYGRGSKIQMKWNHTKECSGYKIYIKNLTGTHSWELISVRDKNNTQFTTGNMQAGEYACKVTAYNNAGESFNPPLQTAYVLKQPTNLHAEVLSSSEVKLTYDPIDSNATTILIEKSSDGVTYTNAGTVSTSSNYITVQGLIPDKDYYMRITAVRGQNISSPSNVVHFKTPVLQTALQAPDNLTTKAVSPSEVDLEWNDNSDNEDGFKIERKVSGGMYTVIATVSADTTTYKDTGLNDNTTYYYRVKAFNEQGESGYSNEANATTPQSQTAPNAPTNLTATVNSCTEVTLSWTDNSDNEEHFVIERKEEGGTYAKLATVDPDTTTYTDSTVEEGKTYYYKVKATNSTGNSGYSNEASADVPECATAPEAPSNLTATAVSSSEIVLSWTDNSDNEDGFKIERKVSGGIYKVIATVASDTTSYQDTGLSAGTTYYYRLRAFNDEGFSAYTNSANATTESNAVQKTVIKLWPDNPNMLVNGVKQEIDPGRGTKPVIIPKWGRTVVPIRAIVEALGGTIEWDGKERKVTINFNGTTIELWIDNPKARVNGQPKWIDENNHDVKPIIVNDRTMLPLRFVAESLGCKVDWDPKTRTITITYPAS